MNKAEAQSDLEMKALAPSGRGMLNHGSSRRTRALRVEPLESRVVLSVQFSDQMIVMQSETQGFTSMYSADLDGDGDMDVLSASRDDCKIAWHENETGNGTFGPQQIITTHNCGPVAVDAADLDGDGDIDVLAASSADGKLAWYENEDGKGSFGTRKDIARGVGVSVRAADLDGDGDIDVISAISGKISWYENLNGTDDFGQEQVISTEVRDVQSVHAADLDRDGDMDVLSASFDGKIAWYENEDGRGTFGPQKLIIDDGAPKSSVFAADLDSDGDLDVLAAVWGNRGKIVWYPQKQRARFGAQKLISDDVSYPSSVYAADLDGDGYMDVLSRSPGKIAWYTNEDGSGSFRQKLISSGLHMFGQNVSAADLDGDGDLDVLSAHNGPAWHENHGGRGSFGPHKSLTSSVDGASSVSTADVDGDGDIDVLSASAYNDTISWYENEDGRGTFGRQNVITDSDDVARIVHAADFDGDGDVDVLSGSGDGIAWYENEDGKGGIGRRRHITSDSGGARSIYTADVDRDGDLDVISLSLILNAWYENEDGKGTFGQPHVYTPLPRTGAKLYRFDLDGDGDMDVLSNEIAWYENENGEIAVDQKKVISRRGSSSAFAADLDGDGDMDVIASFASEDKIAWYENKDGKGDFGSQEIITTNAEGASSVVAADVDGDGDIDVVAASAYDNKISWYRNQSDNHGPTMVIAEPSPNPRLSSVNEIAIFFSEPILNFDLSDLMLTRNGGTNLLPGSASLSTTDEIIWTLAGLGDLSGTSGQYQLKLDATSSDITNRSAKPLKVGKGISWSMGPGDANQDGLFDSSDLVQVFQGGKYNRGEPADWGQGDWNGDGVFTQHDLVVAFQAGHYWQGPNAAIRSTAGKTGRGQIHALAHATATDLLFTKLGLNTAIVPFEIMHSLATINVHGSAVQ